MYPGAPVAAPKVFAIPELLEKILIFYGCDDADIDDNGLVSQPLRGLYRLQRVNRTFRDNIADSKTLRQLMFLEEVHHSDMTVSKLQSQAVLLWLLRGLAVGVVDGSFGGSLEDYTLHYKGRRTTAGEISQQKALECPPWMGPEASWRKMKLMATTPIILKSQFIDFGINGDWYTKTIECPANSTLGAFFDAYLRLEEAITEGVARSEDRRRLSLARREALRQKHVGPYVLYQRKRLWGQEDADYRISRDMELDKFFVLQRNEATNEDQVRYWIV
ncbi:hypothetical protein HII31_00423 [Pseudocercospora fuligena]|uniref:Uncharacterized protein n=1 Tax=Pseudocercospora fuligena TaxID=685502 RepID=A0A8H6RW97_9PEZI|nr:hypothetical protein HII31_00423 [Pseudocercospora fuligena]